MATGVAGTLVCGVSTVVIEPLESTAIFRTKV